MQADPTASRLRALPAILAFALMFAPGGVSAARADTSTPATSVPATGVQGWWLTTDGKAAINIAACGAQLCGKVEWLKEPLDPNTGKPKTDIHNPDATLRPRPVCDLTMLGNFTQNADGSWGGGWIYDPASGNTYKSNMHVGEDGKLHVRGFVGVPLFGRSEIMTRPAAPLTPCVPGSALS
jgi:uncharacterized protein (DUF2147 family)